MKLADHASLQLEGRGELPPIDAEVTVHDPPLLYLGDAGDGFVVNGLYTLLDVGEDCRVGSHLTQGGLSS